MLNINVLMPGEVQMFYNHPAGRTDPSLAGQLVADLERMLRFSSITKTVEVPKDIVDEASTALAKARGIGPPTAGEITQVEVLLLQAIDKITPRIYPATPLSLEIAELMEGQSRGVTVIDSTSREGIIYRRVQRLIKKLMWFTLGSLLLVIASFAGQDIFNDTIAHYKTHVGHMINVIVGLLGACAYILRSILTRLAAQTFVLIIYHICPSGAPAPDPYRPLAVTDA